MFLGPLDSFCVCGFLTMSLYSQISAYSSGLGDGSCCAKSLEV